MLLAFRHLPIEQIHKQVIPAAKAATCAGDQGKFWTAHDGLFKTPDILKTECQSGFAASYGLNAERFGACMKAQSTDERVREDMELAKKYNVKRHPRRFSGRWTDVA